jgi:phosphoenolpyruvate carboxykinase (GTP)
MAPSVAYRKLEKLVRGSLSAGALYVVPHVVENLARRQGRVVVELTNSYHGILSIGGGGRIGKEALDALGESSAFSRGFHVCLSSAPKQLLVCYFPQDDATWSVSS